MAEPPKEDKVELHRALTRVLAARIPRDCASDLELLRDYIENSEPVKSGRWDVHDVVKILSSGKTLDGFCSVKTAVLLSHTIIQNMIFARTAARKWTEVRTDVKRPHNCDEIPENWK